jgi:hydrogenase maturation protease
MTQRTLILRIGNLLWADEGFGVRCAERLAQRVRFGAEVRLMDGGTQGLYLLPFREAADALVVFDAVDYGLPPGTLKVVEGDAGPAFLGARKMSLHRTGFRNVIATARLMDCCPARLLLIGCQPVELEDYGGGLRAEVAARIDPAIDVALGHLAAWGVSWEAGAAPAADQADPALRRDACEGGRPSVEEACRTGEARFLPAGGAQADVHRHSHADPDRGRHRRHRHRRAGHPSDRSVADRPGRARRPCPDLFSARCAR